MSERDEALWRALNNLQEALDELTFVVDEACPGHEAGIEDVKEELRQAREQIGLFRAHSRKAAE